MKDLLNEELNIKVKLSALWASVLSCYIYCDYFELYVPGKLKGMLDGTTIFGQGDQATLLGLSSILLLSSLMIAFSVLLPVIINRFLNLIVSLMMTLMMCYLAMIAGWYFYKMFALVEALLTLTIFWQAWNWPKSLPKQSNIKDELCQK